MRQFRLAIFIAFLCIAALGLLLQYRTFGPGIITDLSLSGSSRATRSLPPPPRLPPLPSFISESESTTLAGVKSHIVDHVVTSPKPTQPFNCRMDNCFDFSKCKKDFKVYVYPPDPSNALSQSYQNILNVIKSSQYYTLEVDKACVFISNIDTLDRDSLSENYVHNLQQKLTELPHWNNGKNHVIYNLYSGTWPDYSEQFGIDIGEAMLAKASVSTHKFRAGFDISLPLFHKELPELAGEQGQLLNINIPSNNKYLLAFKGKRYLTGVGSASRNSLHHIHNSKDIILLTTCRHGKGWEKSADERCAQDNDLYDKYDYEDLLANSTFCLVPRGRRLGSFRFLEVLRYGCIPVLLSDNWELPFSDVIDWKQAAIWADENLLYQIPYSLRSIPYTTISSLQQQSQVLWSKYFSSFEKIVVSTLQIIKERVDSHNAQSRAIWNTHPGAYSLPPTYSKDLTQFPFFTKTNSTNQFTALLYITERSLSLRRGLESITSASNIHSIYIFVVGRTDLNTFISSVSQSIKIPAYIRYIANVSDSYKFYKVFPTDAVLIINQRDHILTEELDFAFSIWKEFPSQIVGHLGRSHLWHNGEQKYHYTSKLSNQYSIVSSDTAVIHKYYLHQMMTYADRWGHLDNIHDCSDMLLNFLVSDITGLPPIKVGQRRILVQHTPNQFKVNDLCMDTLYRQFGYLPLLTSYVRLDPALFKDNVSRTRKRYPSMEKIV